MSTESSSVREHYDIVIVGAGPTGSAMAGDLGRRGRSVLLLERGDGAVFDARLHSVNIRTMELARHWGIETDLRNCGWPSEHPQDVVWGFNLKDDEVARIDWPAISEMTPPDCSPTFAQRCPQVWFNPILLDFARRQTSVDVRLHHEMIGFEQGEDAVRVDVRTPNGATVAVQGSYLVAADGARSSVRRALGVPTVKSPVLGSSAEIIFRCPELSALPLTGSFGRFTVLERDGMSVSLLPFDGRGTYRLTVMVGGGEKTDEQMKEIIRSLAGLPDADIELLTPVMPWSSRETLAEAFRVGRVFLAGDAAHTMPTTGGMGMNTGVGDSLDLGWKLDAVLAGWGGEGLLDSYDIERRAAVTRTSSFASGVYKDWVATKHRFQSSWDLIEQGGSAEHEGRTLLAETLLTTFSREYNAVPAALGYRYDRSPVVIPDGSRPLPDDVTSYVPTAAPGHRAPHVWVEPGRSTLDLFGPGFTLLIIGRPAGDAQALSEAAQNAGLPLAVLCYDFGPVRDDLMRAYEAHFVLVRPDGHVAWRAHNQPDDPERIVDLVRGVGRVDETQHTSGESELAPSPLPVTSSSGG
ncbi:FAD-dependent monooxygenase [Rhodococcus sp. NPDC057014]|uniref:FAD-dependent monooxygenase n=1 Tax=Rhodococcus sp. NPDC057014 TaxID=3346000 RepID=UPI003629C562